MMKNIELVISKPGTSASKVLVPIKDPSRIVGVYVSGSAGESSAHLVTFGSTSGTPKRLFQVDLDDCDGSAFVAGVRPTSGDAPTEKEREHIFTLDDPLEIGFNLTTDQDLSVIVITDPFLIGAHEGLSS